MSPDPFYPDNVIVVSFGEDPENDANAYQALTDLKQLDSQDQIRIAGARSPQVSRRLTAALQDLETVVSGDRLAAVRHQRALLSEATNAAVTDADDLDFALRPDRQGIGVRAGAPHHQPGR